MPTEQELLAEECMQRAEMYKAGRLLILALVGQLFVQELVDYFLDTDTTGKLILYASIFFGVTCIAYICEQIMISRHDELLRNSTSFHNGNGKVSIDVDPGYYSQADNSVAARQRFYRMVKGGKNASVVA